MNVKGPIAQPCPVPAAKPLQQVYAETVARLKSNRDWPEECPVRVTKIDLDVDPNATGMSLNEVNEEIRLRWRPRPMLAEALLAQLKTAWSGCMLGEDRDQATGEKFVRRIARACGIEGA